MNTEMCWKTYTRLQNFPPIQRSMALTQYSHDDVKHQNEGNI